MNIKKRFLIKLMRVLGFGGMAAYCIVGSSCYSVQNKVEGELEEKEQPAKDGINLDSVPVSINDTNHPVIEENDSITNPQDTNTDNNNTDVPSEEVNDVLPENDFPQPEYTESPNKPEPNTKSDTDLNNSENERNSTTIEDDPKYAKIFKKYKKSSDFTVQSRSVYDPLIVITKGGRIEYPINSVRTKEGTNYYPSEFVTIVENSKGKHFALLSNGTVSAIPDELFREPEGKWEGCSPGKKYGCLFVKKTFVCTYNKKSKKHECEVEMRH